MMHHYDSLALAQYEYHEFTVPEMNYTQGSLISTINNTIQGRKVKFIVTTGMKTMVKYLRSTRIPRIKLSKPLSHVLGWPTQVKGIKLTSPITSPGTIQVNSGFEKLFMYAPGLVKECMVGDVMAAFMGTVTPVFDHDVHIVEPPIVVYRPIREDLPPMHSIRLDLHDGLGRPLIWVYNPAQKPQATLQFRSKEISLE